MGNWLCLVFPYCKNITINVFMPVSWGRHVPEQVWVCWLSSVRPRPIPLTSWIFLSFTTQNPLALWAKESLRGAGKDGRGDLMNRTGGRWSQGMVCIVIPSPHPYHSFVLVWFLFYVNAYIITPFEKTETYLCHSHFYLTSTTVFTFLSPFFGLCPYTYTFVHSCNCTHSIVYSVFPI